MEIASQTTPRFTPRAHLNSQETVLFDTRPHFVAVVGVGTIIWFLFGSLLVPTVGAGVEEGLRATSNFWFIFVPWFLMVCLPLLTGALAWWHEFYSLSDQRIMHGHGFINRSFDAKQLTRIGGMLDVSTYRITGVTFSQRLMGRLLNFGDLDFQTNHGRISWHGIKDPLNVRRLIEEKIATFQDAGANQVTYNEAVIKKVAEIKTEASFGLIAPIRQSFIQGMEGGASLPAGPSAVRYCSNCGGQQNGEAAYCSRCGSRLG
jgi:hypothetical protein